MISSDGRSPGVALLIETDGPGGAERTLLHLAEGLRDRGYRVVPIGPAEGSGWLSGEFRQRGFDREGVQMGAKFDPRSLLDLVRIFRKRRVNIVHAHEFHFAVYGTAAARLAHIPAMITLHGGSYYDTLWYRRRALRIAALRSRKLVTVSSSLGAELERRLTLPPGMVEVIPNGVPVRRGDGARIRRELKMGERDPLLLVVGNLYPVKGHDVFIRALECLQRLHPELEWTAAIAGRGGEEAALRALAAQLGVEKRVHFLGFREDVPDLLAAASLLAIPSRREEHPLALLEAMFAGVPVVATRVGGIPEVVTHRSTGLLVPSGAPEAMASSIARLLAEPLLRSRIVRGARGVARERFTLDAMLDRYEAAYALRKEGGSSIPTPRMDPSARAAALFAAKPSPWRSRWSS